MSEATQNDSNTSPGFQRKVRSFVRREGRLTPSQEYALEHYWPKYGLTIEQGPLDFNQAFGRQASTVVEIGFGMGHSLIEMAQQNPEVNYIGIEVHRPGVGMVLREIAAHQLTNLRVYAEDAVEVLEQCISDGSLAGLQLYFPDPWPKKKHHKRRIVQPEFVERIRQKLQVGGFFHLATDWQPYTEHMLEVMEVAEGFVNKFGKGQFSPDRFGRPETKFERRGQKLGHGVWDLVYERVG